MKVKIEGINLSDIINKCISREIRLRNLKWKNMLESTAEVEEDDFDGLKAAAGHSYKVTVLKEGGVIPFFRSLRANVLTVAGAFLLGAFLFYQSLFIAEVRIDGYKSISEERIRDVIAETGLYEGARRQESYETVKSALYDEFEDITWVGISEEGRLVRVSIAEASGNQEAEENDETPVDIVAKRSAMVERILPLKGNAVVQKGDYVNEGDILISGAYEYQSSDYSRGDDVFTMYSHASGQVLAKTPRRLTYYVEKNIRTMEGTGRAIRGIYLRIGDVEIDTAASFNEYVTSRRSEKTLLNTAKPVPIRLNLVKIEEVTVSQRHRDMEKVKAVVEAAVRQYAREELSGEEEILGKTVDYRESAGVIRAEVLLEVLEEIGMEREIAVEDDGKGEKTVREETEQR